MPACRAARTIERTRTAVTLASGPWPETSATTTATVPSGRVTASHQSPATTPSADCIDPATTSPGAEDTGDPRSSACIAATSGASWTSPSFAA